MTQWRLRSKRGSSGKLLHPHRKKRRMDASRDFSPVTVGETKAKNLRGRGGNYKRVLKTANIANVMVKGKYMKAKIVTVKDNPANLQYSRRNIITKGAIIQTDSGMAKVTSRPGQHGIINAILIEEKKK